MIVPSLVGVALFGFSLSYDEIARTSQSVVAPNTLPLELQAMRANAITRSFIALGDKRRPVVWSPVSAKLGARFDLPRQEIDYVPHRTTIGANAVPEHGGAVTGMV